jgi:tight adherence protein C
MNNMFTLPFELRFAGFEFGPFQILLLVLAAATALVSLVELTRAWRRDRLHQRVVNLRRTATERTATARQPRASWYVRLGNAIAQGPLVGVSEQRRLAEKLARAGFGGSGRVATFIAARVLSALAGCTTVWLGVEFFQVLSDVPLARYFLVFLGLAIGWRLPDIVVTWLARRRKLRLEIGFPDALDLMVICAEAGLALEQAMSQVAHDLRRSTPDVAEEFGITASEMRVMADRQTALGNLAERTGLESLNGMISVLNQSVKFGTPLSEALRQLAAESRMVRMARLEERGARLSVTLLLPVMLFLLPCLFLVIGGPIAIRAIDTFGGMMGG